MQLTEEQRKALIEGEVTYSRLFEALKGLYEVEDDDAVWEIFNQTDDPLEDVVCALKLLTTKPPVAAPAVPEQGSDAVNDAAWLLHDLLAEGGPLTGHQFNNLKGSFYEAMKVALGVSEPDKPQ